MSDVAAGGRPRRAPGGLTPARRDGLLPLSLQQVSVAGPQVVGTSKNLVDLPIGTSPDLAALGRALALVVARHEPLRLRLAHRRPEADGRMAGRRKKAQRFVPPPADFPVDVLRCHDAGGAEEDAAIDRFFERELDVVTDGPLRAGLLLSGRDDARLLLVVHHLAWDGLSRIPLERDLRTAYHALATGTEPMLPPLRASYSDYVIAQWRAGTQLTPAQVNYWDRVFSGWDADQAPGLTAPAPLPARSGAWTMILAGRPPAADLQPRIQRAARAMRVTPASVWLAAVFIVLWSGHDEDSVCLYWVYHGRDRAEWFDLVGFFSRSVPLRMRMDPQQSFDGLCRELFAQALSAIRHSAAPYSRRRLGDHLLGPRSETGGDGDRPRLARVTVNIHTSSEPGPGINASQPDPDEPNMLIPSMLPRPAQLWLELSLGAARPTVHANYDRRIFSDTLAGAYLSDLMTVLEAVMASGPQLTLAELRKLTLGRETGGHR